MAITFSIAPNPHWVVIDDFSKLPIGAVIYTYESLNPSVFKPAYEDPAGEIPYGQPIQGLGNGTFPPIYWSFDSDNPMDLYYIEVWTDLKPPLGVGELLWSFSGISGATGGGGSVITTNLDLENLVVNGEFYRNCGNLPASPGSLPVSLTLAPSNNAGYCGLGSTSNDLPAPDIVFNKSDNSATDSVAFTNFPQGDTSLSPNPTPQFYANYTCTVAGTESFRYIQFPIVKGLQNINNIPISVQMWNRLNGGNSNITLNLRQFCGNGTNGPSADVITPLGSLNLTGSTWTQTQITGFTVPSISGLTLGNCGNDALFLQIRFPSSSLINLDFILPCFYLGDVNSITDFHTLDFVNSIVNSPRTGDVRISINSFNPYGWVVANDGTIGNASSNATARANIDTFPLFDLIWRQFQGSQTLAPMFTSAGSPTAYGGTSWNDFGANNQIALTRNLGRVMAGALPVAASQSFTRASNTITMTSTAAFYTGMAVTVSGGSLPTPLAAGTIYYAVVINSTTLSLATSTANAINPTPVIITLTGAGTGTIISVNIETLGSYIGEESHFQSQAELPPSLTNIQINGTVGNFGSGGADVGIGPTSGTPTTTNMPTFGSGVPFNVIQPTVFMNVFFKL